MFIFLRNYYKKIFKTQTKAQCFYKKKDKNIIINRVFIRDRSRDFKKNNKLYFRRYKNSK